MAAPTFPLEPMLAKLARSMPTGDYLYEPKWDGFRCLIFRHGDTLRLQSRSGKPLDRYFPELIDTGDGSHDPLRRQLPQHVVLDGELVVPSHGQLDFDLLSQRIHPAASRIELLARTIPAHYVAFDLLAIDGHDLTATPFEQRRSRLERLLESAAAPLHLTPATRDPAIANDWFARFEGAGLDGVIAKPLGDPYAPGRRTLLKVKRERTADVVVAGFRRHAKGGVGSLMLGLWDDDGLVHVGVASSFNAATREQLVSQLQPHELPPGAAHPWLAGSTDDRQAPLGTERTPRGVNRWNSGKDTSWQPLAPTLVAEVAYDQLTGNRFRHSARFRRWRPDREPASCTFEQLERVAPAELDTLFAL